MKSDIPAVLMLDVDGTELTKADIELLKHPVCGGLILFSRNYENPNQLAALVKAIRKARPDILIAVDQEGGRVQRFKEGFTRLPPMEALAERYQQDAQQAQTEAFQLGVLMAAELIEYGVDISFAPVLDLNFGHSQVIGDRSFGGTAEQVVDLAGSFIDGMSKAGMAATGKHFPGHGHVAADSHLELPIDNRAFSDIEAQDLIPFAKLAPKLKGIMPAHVVYSQVDKDPAGFSEYWLQRILRQQLGFTGVIFSDDLGMAGAAGVGDYGARAKAALNAGCDMVLVCNDREGAISTINYLETHTFNLEPVAASLLSAQQQQVDDELLQPARQLASNLTANMKTYTAKDAVGEA